MRDSSSDPGDNTDVGEIERLRCFNLTKKPIAPRDLLHRASMGQIKYNL